MSEESLHEQVPADAATAREPNMREELRLHHVDGDSPPARPMHELIFLLVLLCNAVTVGLGGLYGSTRSVIVVTLAAGLVALLGGLCLVVGRRSDS